MCELNNISRSSSYIAYLDLLFDLIVPCLNGVEEGGYLGQVHTLTILTYFLT